mgnify:CR=1 FL=1|jgi:hypothetical protein
MKSLSKEQKRFVRARHRVSQLKSYYIHILIYVIANLFISGVKVSFALRAGETWSEAIFSYNTLSVWVVWGVFLLVHTFRVIGLPYLLGYDWESRKLEQFVDDELRKEQNFKV